MQNTKLKIFYILIPLVSAILYAVNKSKGPIDFGYVSVDCAIYDINAKIIFNQNVGHICDTASDGSMIVMRLGLFDSKNAQVWDIERNIHHDLKYSRDGKS